jgi:hypothetical protein
VLLGAGGGELLALDLVGLVHRLVAPQLGRLDLTLADEVEERDGRFDGVRDDADTHVTVRVALVLVDDGLRALGLVDTLGHRELRLLVLVAAAPGHGEVLVDLHAANGQVGLRRDGGRHANQEVVVLDVRPFLVLPEAEAVDLLRAAAVVVLGLLAAETRLDGVDNLVALDRHVHVEADVHLHLLFGTSSSV